MLPAVLSVVGSILPSVISALAGSKTEDQARAQLKPRYEAMVGSLIGNGMNRPEAEAHADEAIKGEVASAMQEGALPRWAEGLLGVAGGIGGWMAGAKLAAKAGAAALAEEGAGALAPKVTGLDSPFPRLGGPRSPAPGGGQPRGVMPEAAPGPNQATGATIQAGYTPPSTRGFQVVPPDGGTMPMSDDEQALQALIAKVRQSPFPPRRTPDPTLNIGMGPETGRRLDLGRMRGSMYGREGD